MTLQELKLNFFTELNEQYPATEIESFFFWLTQSELNISRLEMALDPQKEVHTQQMERFRIATSRLKNYEPIQYIVGETEFYGCLIKVNPSVLIPRPETEELVAWMVEDLKDKKEAFRILDIGTGSGCIPISLAKSLPQAEISAIDISAEAIKTAKENANLNKVKVEFLQQDILKTEKLDAKFEVIVSNPPYVRELEKKMMQENVLKHEPNLALFVSDENPLIFYRKIAQLAYKALSEKGVLYFEINEYLAKETEELLYEIGFSFIEIKNDIFDKSRMIKAIL
ncbi:MAG: peptide chain release factor N(5)-glutamine methyltransferase [Mesonia sp.]